MTYFLLDKYDYVCELGTLRGLEELATEYPEFVNAGETSDIGGVVKAMLKLGWTEQAEAVRKATPPLIITDGIVYEE